MCGICGIVGNFGNQKKYFGFATSLMIETQTRGRHASGFACLGDRSEFFKAPLPAKEFVETPEWLDFAIEPQPLFLIGHCRFATQGSPEVNENNHPFISQDGRYAFIHNGVISGHHELARKQNVNLTTECDSEVVLRVIETEDTPAKGIKKAMRMVLNYWRDGACALLDFQEETLYLFRNMSRPCHVARLPEFGNSIAFASTKSILETALRKSIGKNAKGASFELKPFRIYKLKMNGTGQPEIETTDVKMPEHKTESYFGRSRMSPRTTRAGNRTYRCGTGRTTQENLWGEKDDCSTRDRGRITGTLYAPEEVFCVCGRSMWLFKGERQLCFACKKYELEIGQPARAIGPKKGKWARYHCSECGMTFEQRHELKAKCIKCGEEKRIEEIAPRKKKELTTGQSAIWRCDQCGLRFIAPKKPKKCMSCQNRGFVYEGDVDHLER